MIKLTKKISQTFVLAAASVLMLGACADDSTSDSSSEASGSSGEAQEFDFSHMFPSNHVMETEVVQEFKALTEDATNSEVQIISYPGAQLAEPDAQYETAATGVADMGFSVHSYTPGQFPLTSVMELPFMSETGVEGSQILWELYEEFPELQDEYEDTVPLWTATSEPGQIFTVGKQVKSVEDLEGMRIRSPSPEVNRWLEEMGATPVSMSMNETYEALERGVVDGTVGPFHTLLDYSLHEVIDYVTVGNFYMTTFFAVMNQSSWDSISEENQSAMEDINGEHMSQVVGETMDKRAEEAAQAAEEAGAEFYELSDEENEEWSEYLQPAIDAWIEDKEEKGLPGQDIYDRAIELGSE
ncbi:TRAP transporter substrate-binding protein [Alteribacillus sp. YIM 98480]|uniref:TRAP transporter substrate-binding protein n=1 Tax=Alteribacillus sp. YIM 98480 TaxID=2606599 RepID=UPI001E60DB8F|nr:TRAP transporter substrate-binding protein [Alteribacillus sp. YIM 98480]